MSKFDVLNAVSRRHIIKLASTLTDGVIGRPSLWIAEDFGCCASG